MLVGPNGSGKSTFLRCLATALRPHEGTIRWGDDDLWQHRHRLRRQLAYLGHAAHIYDDLSAAENLRTWALLAGSSPDIGALLRDVGLDPERRDPARTFSAGMRRRLSIARILVKQPGVILLDEPFSALDPAGRSWLSHLLVSLRDKGATLVLATHLPTAARAICDRAIALEDGQTTFVGGADEALQDAERP